MQLRYRRAGFTFLELLLVVAILGFVAMAAIPSLSSTDPYRLDLAAAEVAAAMRFARAQAQRTGTDHGFHVSAFSQRARVYSKPGSSPVWDVYHPVDKKLYDLDLASDPLFAGVKISSGAFWYDGLPLPSEYLGFNARGEPKYQSSGSAYPFASGEVRLSYRGHERVIQVAPLTGRVTVQ